MRRALLLSLSLAGFVHADELFEMKVRPLLVERCGACHIQQSLSGLRVDSRDALLKGGTRGPAIQPGDPQASLLLRAVRHSDPKLKMPPGSKLAAPEIEALEKWVAAGAKWPEGRLGISPGVSFWSFEPLPAPVGTLDSHVRRGLAAKGLLPNPPAPRRDLLRRLTYDLVGLPPTPDQRKRFLQDNQPVAALVDDLLASPQFGERWGRHWLDVARYGEDDFSGTEPKPYPNAWRYRDWVIDAFNRDLPYDEFVRAQLAADLYPRFEGDMAALGLQGLGPWYFGISQPPQARADERHDRVDFVTRGLLGITAACARCHDHKYDPIPQRDYYALAGVFASTAYRKLPLVDAATAKAYDDAQKRIKKLEKEIETFLASQRDQLAAVYARQTTQFLLARPGVDPDVQERWRKYLAKKEEDHPFLKPWQAAATPEAKEAAAREFQQTLLAAAERKKEIDELNREAVIRGVKPDEKRRKEILPFDYDSEADFNPGADVVTVSLDRERYQLLQKFFGGREAVYRLDDKAVEARLSPEFRKHLETLRTELAEVKKSSPPPYPYLQVVREHEQPLDLPLNLRGNPFQLGEPVPRHFLSCLSNGAAERWTEGSGRKQLAEAVVGHPLAARVMANRVWAWLFGAGIVRTPSNFGSMGDRPANRELLDQLASRFAQGFSVKKLVREIVLSDAYQATSTATAAATRVDPDNRLFWRMNRKRLDAEGIRDAMLAVSGELDLRAGGESAELSDDHLRRTVYARVGRYQQNETLALFDFPSASVHAEQRASTNVPLQKLFFLNSAFVARRAEAFARRAGTVDNGYQILFQRAPAAEEKRLAETFLAAEPWPRFAQVLLSSNEFLYVD